MLAHADRSLNQGFTIVELMITLVIVGILATIALPSFSDFIRRGQVRSVTESVSSAMQLTRNEAVKRNEQVTMSFVLEARAACNGDGNILRSWNVLNEAGDVVQQASLVGDSGGEVCVVITPNSPDLVRQLVFNGLGRVVASNNSVTRIVFNFPGIDQTRQIDVASPGGQVRVCDPAITTLSDPRRCMP